MSRSLLYAVNSTAQTITAGGNVSFGAAVRRFGCNTTISNGSPVIKGSGYYKISAAITGTPTAAGTLAVTLYQDGVAVPGGVYTQEVTDDVWQIDMPEVIIRENACCCDRDTTITATVTGLGLAVSLASIVVEKV